MSCIPRFVLLIALLLLPIAAEAQGLFVDLPSTRAMSDSARPAVPGTVKRSRVAMIDAAYLARNVMPDISMAAGQKLAAKLLPVLLPLFPDIVLNLDGEQVEASVDGSTVWTGRVTGAPVSAATLVVKDGMITGQITVGTMTIEIRPILLGMHRISEIDQGAFPKEGEALKMPGQAPSGTPAPAPDAPRASADGGAALNVLVVYGDRSAAASADIGSEIRLAVATSNAVYVNSGIPITLNLVGTQQISGYDESARSYETILNDLTGTSDGRLDAVHSLRSSLKADLVVYLTERAEYCGLAWLYNGYPQYAFSVVTRSCATSNYSFVHELGHNMGADHDRYVNGGGSSGAYNYGYVDTTARIRTVMAYNDKCAAQGFACTRIPFFSSPYLTYNGVALGVNPWSTQAAYNVRRLTETRSAVSAFRNGTAAAPTPASGWWWNASEAGRGYSIEIQGNALFFAAYSYAADGTALWYVSSGQMGDNKTSYVGDLQQYAGGQTLNGSYKPATVLGSAGKLQIYFDSETTGYLVFPGGSGTSISRFDFITNGSVGGPAPGYPQTGWWWNASEAGRGYFIEAQNTSMFVSFYMYNAAGQAVWYIASGVMTSADVFQGTLQEYSGGSPLTSAFRAPNGANNIGAVTIQFASGTAAVLTLPNGAQVSLSRFTF